MTGIVPNSYHLTSTKPTLACFGTSFSNLASAKNYAFELQTWGLCEEYNIGCYKDGKFTLVYKSSEQSKL